jgi:hypothetical protein
MGRGKEGAVLTKRDLKKSKYLGIRLYTLMLTASVNCIYCTVIIVLYCIVINLLYCN